MGAGGDDRFFLFIKSSSICSNLLGFLSEAPPLRKVIRLTL
jgi:hypothetical protein